MAAHPAVLPRPRSRYGLHPRREHAVESRRSAGSRLLVSNVEPSPADTLGLYRHVKLLRSANPLRAGARCQLQINSDGQINRVSYLNRFDTDAVYLKGWMCEASGARPNFHTLACTLDRITLKGVLPTAAAQNFFEERMKRSPRCSAEPVSQTTDTRPPRPPRRLSSCIFAPYIVRGRGYDPRQCGPLVLVAGSRKRVWCGAIRNVTRI